MPCECLQPYATEWLTQHVVYLINLFLISTFTLTTAREHSQESRSTSWENLWLDCEQPVSFFSDPKNRVPVVLYPHPFKNSNFYPPHPFLPFALSPYTPPPQNFHWPFIGDMDIFWNCALLNTLRHFFRIFHIIVRRFPWVASVSNIRICC